MVYSDCKVLKFCGCKKSPKHRPSTTVLDSFFEVFVLICCYFHQTWRCALWPIYTTVQKIFCQSLVVWLDETWLCCHVLSPGCLLPCKFLWKQEVYLVLNFKKMTLCTTSRVAVHPTTRPMDQIIVTQHLLCKTLILLFTLTVHIFYTVHCYEQYL